MGLLTKYKEYQTKNHEIWVLIQVLSLFNFVEVTAFIGLLFYGSSEETMEYFKAQENMKFSIQLKEYHDQLTIGQLEIWGGAEHQEWLRVKIPIVCFWISIFCGLHNLASVSIKQKSHNDFPDHYEKKLINVYMFCRDPQIKEVKKIQMMLCVNALISLV